MLSRCWPSRTLLRLTGNRPALSPAVNFPSRPCKVAQVWVPFIFLPNITPRGTILLQVAPEVRSLDFEHAVTFRDFTIPALATRGVLTEVELESGHSLVIGGLLNNRTTENLNKI